jgi:hypothetical protein
LYFDASFVSESPFTTVYETVCGGALLLVLIVTPGEGVDVAAGVVGKDEGEVQEAGADDGAGGITGPEAESVALASCARAIEHAAAIAIIGMIKCRFFMDAVRARQSMASSRSS